MSPVPTVICNSCIAVQYNFTLRYFNSASCMVSQKSRKMVLPRCFHQPVTGIRAYMIPQNNAHR